MSFPYVALGNDMSFPYVALAWDYWLGLHLQSIYIRQMLNAIPTCRKFLLIFFAPASCIFAGGFQVNLQSVRQAGMGHCGTALAADASGLFFNPGSLAFLKQTSIVANLHFISPHIAYLEPSPGNYTATNEPVL